MTQPPGEKCASSVLLHCLPSTRLSLCICAIGLCGLLIKENAWVADRHGGCPLCGEAGERASLELGGGSQLLDGEIRDVYAQAIARVSPQCRAEVQTAMLASSSVAAKITFTDGGETVIDKAVVADVPAATAKQFLPRSPSPTPAPALPPPSSAPTVAPPEQPLPASTAASVSSKSAAPTMSVVTEQKNGKIPTVVGRPPPPLVVAAAAGGRSKSQDLCKLHVDPVFHNGFGP